MFERFTDRARRVVVLAQEEARMLHHNYIGTEHVLLGLIHEGEGVAAQVMEALGIQLDVVREQVEDIIGRGQETPADHVPFTPRAKKVLELSLREGLQLGHNYIGTEHILLGLVREGEGVAAQVLRRLGADLDRVREQTIALLGERSAAESQSRGSFWRRRRPVPGAASAGVHDLGEAAGPAVGLEQLTDGGLRAVLEARAEARRLRTPELEPEHLVLGLLALDDDPAAAVLRNAGITVDRLRRALDAVTEPTPDGADSVPGLAPITWRALEAAALGARDDPGIDTLALLGALLDVSSAARLLVTSAGGDLDGLREALRGDEPTGG